MEIDSLRGKLSDEETQHKKIQEQLLVEKLKRVVSNIDVNHHSEEIIKGYISPFISISTSSSVLDLEKKLDIERFALKKSHDDLIETQQKFRLLEIDHRELTANYNQLTQDYQTSTKNVNEQIELENQRRIQYDKEIKQFQQQLNQSLQKEKQLQEQRNQLETENERVTKELRQMTNDYQTIKTKIREYEKQIEGRRKRDHCRKNILLSLFSRRKILGNLS